MCASDVRTGRHETPTVLIIGAGTRGMALAHGLKQAGIGVRVFERDRTRRDGVYGYRVGIDPDGSRALHALLPPELFDTFVATCAKPMQGMTFWTETLGKILDLPFPDQHDPIESEKSVSRMTLRQMLLTGMEDLVEFDKTFNGYEQHPEGKVTARFEDGTTATGDLFSINHVMEFPWDREGLVRTGIGGNDADLIAAWPGLLYDNTRDYVMWSVADAAAKAPAGILEARGHEVIRIAKTMTSDWSPAYHRLIELSDPGSCFSVNVATSVPIDDWPPSNVTLVGDAIHTMTPGRGVGANTALRAAQLLSRRLIDVRDSRLPLVEAVADYETKMRSYAWTAVEASLENQGADNPLYKPVVGSLMLAGMRTAFRIVNRVPPLKRRMAASMLRSRGAGREDDDALVQACIERGA